MNKKEKEQLKKIEQLDQQLDQTINKIGVTKITPIKISKKKLLLFILIPFSIACVISALTSFLLIDPFHWYTKPRTLLEQRQEEEIKRINQQFNELNLATSLESSNTIADLLWEMKHSLNINDIVKSVNEIKSITSLKDDNAKLSADGEKVYIKIIVKTGSLEKEIDIELLIIIENQKVKQVNQLVKSNTFLDKIKAEFKADGIKRASNLIAMTKTVLIEKKALKLFLMILNMILLIIKMMMKSLLVAIKP